MKRLSVILFFIVAIVACAKKPSSQARSSILEILDNTYPSGTHACAYWHDHFWEVLDWEICDKYEDSIYEAITADNSLYHQLYDELSRDFHWTLVDDWTGQECIFDEELGITLPVSPQKLHSRWYNDTIYLDLDLCHETTGIIFSKINSKLKRWNPWLDNDTYRSLWLDYNRYQKVVKALSNIYGEPLIIQPEDDMEQDFIWKLPNGGKIHLWVNKSNYDSAAYIAVDNR